MFPAVAQNAKTKILFILAVSIQMFLCLSKEALLAKYERNS